MLGLANTYKCRPSALMDIADPYTAYCFDEACAVIIQNLEDDKEPSFKVKHNSFKELYAQYI